MISKRQFLAGSAVLLTASTRCLAAEAPEGAGARPVEIALRPDPSLVLMPGPSPKNGLRFAGPDGSAVIRVRQGERVSLRFRNETADPVGVTISGLRGWGAVDSSETTAIENIPPGDSRTCAVRPADSGTMLFRAIPSTRNEAQRGAVGVLVVEEVHPPAIDLDMVLLLQDRMIGGDGQFRFGSTPPVDATARILMANGETAPEVVTMAPRSRIRLRVVNGSAQRAMLIGFAGIKPTVIAVDGQPCEAFVPARDVMPIGPGARFDMIIDLPDRPGEDVQLMLRATERLGGELEAERPVLILKPKGDAREPRPPLVALPPNPALPREIPLEAAKRLDLSFAPARPGAPAGWTVNGAATASAPLLTVRQGDAVTLGLFNTSPVLVPIRVQGQAMRVLHAKDDGWDPYWRDTVLLPPKSRTHVAFVADSPGRWAIESAFDDQYLLGLHAWFVVTPR